MAESGSGRGSGSAQAALGSSSLLEAHDHTRLWLQSKLSGDWSAQAGASGLTEERLNTLSRCFGTLDSMVKVRLLLAGLFVPSRERSRLQPLLSELASQAAGNQDEWVRATAAVVGDFSGLLDMRALMAQFPLVRESILKFSSQLGSGELHTPPCLLPETEQYMHRDISRLPTQDATGAAAAGPSSANTISGNHHHHQYVHHFRLREAPGSAVSAGDPLGGPGGASAAGGGVTGSGAQGGGGGGGSLWLSPSGVLAVGSGTTTHSGLGASGSLVGLEGRSSYGQGVGEAAASRLRVRADVTHGKEGSKQGTPLAGTGSGGVSGGGGGAKAGGPLVVGLRTGMNLNLTRSRSLVSSDQQQLQLQHPVPESPHAGGGGAGGAGTPGATPSGSFGSGFEFGSGAGGGGGGGGSAAGMTLSVQGGGTSGQVAVAAFGGGPSATTSTGRGESHQGGVARGSWQGGGAAATTTTATTAAAAAAAEVTEAQHYPLAAAIAFAAAAASGDISAGTLGPFLTASTAESLSSIMPPSYIQQLQQRQQQQQHPHQRNFQEAPQQYDALVAGERQGHSHDDQSGLARDRSRDVYDDGFGVGNDGMGEGVGRRPSHGFEGGHSGVGVARRWSASGGEVVGWQEEDAQEDGFDRGAEYHGREEQSGGEEPDAKRFRPGD